MALDGVVPAAAALSAPVGGFPRRPPPAARRPPPPTHTRPTQWRVLGLGTHTGHHTLGSGGGGEEVAEAAIATNNSIS